MLFMTLLEFRQISQLYHRNILLSILIARPQPICSALTPGANATRLAFIPAQTRGAGYFQ